MYQPFLFYFIKTFLYFLGNYLPYKIIGADDELKREALKNQLF